VLSGFVVLVGGGGGAREAAPVAAPPPVAARAPAAPPPMRVVPPSSLSRRPRAPGLDLELERQYPAEARRSGISGTAVLRVRILPDGRVGEVRVQSESWAGFGPACERTVRAARWEPPIDRDGAPVATEITYTCRFEVRS
ncbi:MAG: energy transducer TonB, partial [Labilithrix sp.]|nr:energy transducer TonB [Labilithrix sp.]